jgi:hypothetical protein
VRALEATPPGSPNRAEYLLALSTELRTRAEQLQENHLFERSLQAATEALTDASDSASLLPNILSEQASAHLALS